MKEVMTLSAFYFTPIPPPTNAVNPSPEKKNKRRQSIFTANYQD
jgi:hypothetical protein